MAKSIERPLSITLVMIYAAIVGLLNIAGGIFTLLDRHDAGVLIYSLYSPAQLTAAGIVAIVVGGIQLLMAAALGTGNNIVRVIFAVIAVFNLAISAWATIALSGEERAAGVFGAVFAVVMLFLLFNQKAEAFFEDNK